MVTKFKSEEKYEGERYLTEIGRENKKDRERAKEREGGREIGGPHKSVYLHCNVHVPLCSYSHTPPPSGAAPADNPRRSNHRPGRETKPTRKQN